VIETLQKGVRTIRENMGVKRLDKNQFRISLPAFALCAAILTAGLAQQPSRIQLTAKKYAFEPSQIHVKKGEHVQLIITAVDHDHGLKLEAFQIDQQLKKGETVTVEFTADQAGTFPFQCAKFCGLGHKNMKGELVVE
jgi:cytochrome c oxidase subunit 2